MLISLRWLRDYVDVDLTPAELADRLTMAGLEVDAVRDVSPDFTRVVVSKILSVKPHPNADKLSLCEVATGTETLPIVCGAANIHAGDVVPLAMVGATIPGGYTIKRSLIRGERSEGMLCSEEELGIGPDNTGILILPDGLQPGQDLADALDLRDTVLDIGVTPNRSDCLSIIGVAREVAAITGRKLRRPEISFTENSEDIQGITSVRILDPDACPRYTARVIRDVDIRPSPAWMRRRLESVGLRAINNVVDVTNFVMMEYGQPLHAFDYDLLKERAGGKPTIITRTAYEGEKITLLDGSEPKLDTQIELVTDTAGPLSIAGVMGGGETGVHAGTRNLLIESANWNFINLRKTLSKTRINSEAGYRFSRDVHPALAETALGLCLKRAQEWGGGEVVQGVLDEYGKLYEDTVNRLSEETILEVIGQEISLEESTQILERLGFTCWMEGDELVAKSPATRTDIETGTIGQRNLIEEIARTYGYERIAAKRLSDELPPQIGNPGLEAEERIRDILVSIGLQDTLAYRQTSPEREARIYVGRKAPEGLAYVRLKNPITPERTAMRRSAMATMLELLEYNAKFRPGLAMFELGPVFLPVEGEILPHEALRLSIGLTGAWDVASWDRAQSPAMDFFDLKGVVEALLDGLHLEGVKFQATSHPSFHPGKCAEVRVGEEVLGVMGELHPQVKKNYTFGQDPVLVAEFDGEALVRLSNAVFTNKAISGYPAMVEDIALIVEESVPADDLEALIWQAGGKLLVDVKLFDVYRDAKLGEGKKSLAYQLTYQAFDRTLTDKDALNIRNRIVKQTKNVFGAILRSS